MDNLRCGVLAERSRTGRPLLPAACCCRTKFAGSRGSSGAGAYRGGRAS